jgi:hypothetical protein
MGWLIPLIVLLPNVLMVWFPPTKKPEGASNVNWWLVFSRFRAFIGFKSRVQLLR